MNVEQVLVRVTRLEGRRGIYVDLVEHLASLEDADSEAVQDVTDEIVSIITSVDTELAELRNLEVPDGKKRKPIAKAIKGKKGKTPGKKKSKGKGAGAESPGAGGETGTLL